MLDKTTRLGKRIANGEIAKGIEHFAGNRAMVEVAAELGFDFNMIDLQLSAYDLETVEMMVATSRYAGITTLVRVPELQSSTITRVLNMGVNGIIVPDVDSGEMARDVVNAVKFQPEGKRMACPMIRAAKYGLTPWKEYVDQAAKEIMSCVIVESEKGVNNIEEIAATSGLDIMWLGAWDLSLSLGIQGANYTHPTMRHWLEKAGEVCKKNNVVLYTTTAVNTDPEYFKLVTSHANMICMFSDIGIFAKGCKRVLEGQGL
jgi:2-keto-3-deoxy-L-rhamnonate aldolase RhmA